VRPLGPGPASALLVPVPGAAALRSSGPGELPPHVTILFPFLGARLVDDAVVAALEAVLGAFPPFRFALADVGRFPGVLYLAAQPGEPFAALTTACVRRWPEHPPYGGAYDELVAHLTLAEGPEPAGLADRAAAALPLDAVADEVWLMTRGRTRGWRRRAAIALRGPGG
jgi:2'-5' RNA ligase